ncbi:dephospho-CoA kinase [Spirochaetia bacterium]|nr:dephospho-CoA kinase [Spirochaetia bacterium]
MIIGLAGSYCAGKNYAAAFLEARGLPVLDVDKLGHQVLDLEKDAVAARFGPSVLDGKGRVNRRLLGEKVFGKNEELKALEDIVHPGTNRLTAQWIEAQQGRPCVLNAALIHKSSAFVNLSTLIIVKAPLCIRLLRAKHRDKLPWKEIFRRFASQKSFNAQYLTKFADIYTVNNIGKNLEKQIDKILSQLGIGDN